MSANTQTSTSQPIVISAMTAEEEEQILLTRIVNDERPLKRVMKKYHTFSSLAHPAPNSTAPASSKEETEEAREAFLVELASFQLLLKKSAMICEAEARQVEEYQREKQRIDDEHGTLRGQIEQLKTSLDHAQMSRKRKIEYDSVAEKVNTLPSREELESNIQSLEEEMAAIRAEQENQNQLIQNQKSALDSIISDLGQLRFAGKDKDTVEASIPTPTGTPAPDSLQASAGSPVPTSVTAPADSTPQDDIEMGEVAEVKEVKKSKSKKHREDMEEGEATDGSSELSDIPEDI